MEFKVRTSDRTERSGLEVDDGPGLDEVVGGVHDLAVDEAARLLVDAVGRDLGLDLVEGLRGLTVASMAYVQVLQDAGTRGIEARRVFEALGHVEHADASIEISGHLAVDRPANAVLDIQ